MNRAARTTLSPSVGPKHLYLARVWLCLEPHYCLAILFVPESGPSHFTDITGIPYLDVQI